MLLKFCLRLNQHHEKFEVITLRILKMFFENFEKEFPKPFQSHLLSMTHSPQSTF